MEYKQFIINLKKIARTKFISLNYSVGDNFSYKVDGNIITLQLDNKYIKNRGRFFHFKSILEEINGKPILEPGMLKLGWEQSIEILFHHYPYGFDDKSNCVLLSNLNDIIGISFNNLDNTTFIYTDTPFIPDFIVLNNKFKIEGKYKKSDFDTLLPYLKQKCAE